MVIIKGENLTVDITAKVRGHLEEMDGFNNVLIALKEYTLEEFLADADIRSRAERNMHGALEAAMSVGSQLIVTSGDKLPNTYEAIFSALGEDNIIAGDLAGRLRRLEDFHNILVHGQITDWAEVYDQLGLTTDFTEFIGQVREYLRRRD